MKSVVKVFLKDMKILLSLPVSKRYEPIQLDDYPFDAQLLNLSPLYRQSRQHYLSIGGEFSARVSSMLRSLRAQDLFKNEIEFTPSFAEMIWFAAHYKTVDNPEQEVNALKLFNENSLFHEQNHRVIWKILPPAPKDQAGFRRYLNFAESLVVMLDLALGAEIGTRLSPAFERMNLIYRPAGKDKWHLESKKIYRQYLVSLFCATYYALELIHHEDILKAVNYVLPDHKKMNPQAVRRGLELSELFTKNTNPQWQSLYWKQAQKKLATIHQSRTDDAFEIAADPLDLNIEFSMVRSVLDFYGL